eukprot:1191545-Prorocentrum_minimum.AAC.3
MLAAAARRNFSSDLDTFFPFRSCSRSWKGSTGGQQGVTYNPDGQEQIQTDARRRGRSNSPVDTNGLLRA